MTYATDVTANHALIENLGNLVITDSEGEGKISYQYTGADTNFGKATNTITTSPGSVLTIDGGLIENLTTANGIAYAIDALTNGGAGDVELNINAGTITSKKIAVRVFANSTTNTGTLNISGGEITGRVIVQNANASANKAVLNITGGTFTANEYKTDVLYVGGNNGATIDMSTSVSGGKFKGEILDSTDKPFISGGFFTTDVSEFLVEGSEMDKSEAEGFAFAVVPKSAAEIDVVFEATGVTGEYLVKLESEDGYKIYEFTSAELTFKNDSVSLGGENGTLPFEFVENDKIDVEQSLEDKNTYSFALKNPAARISDTVIELGTIKFTSQGTPKLAVTGGKVVATRYNTNLPKYYVANDIAAEYVLDISATLEGALVPDTTRDVAVNIAYNLNLVGNVWADDEIKVTLVDSFGTEVKATKVDNGLFTFDDVKTGRIEVKLSAPGFRTYTYDAVLYETEEENNPLVLNFWNNVKRGEDEDPLAKIDNSNAVKKEMAHNFVVGDIVMDFIVDRYDLAAVTSYYGMYDITNRDNASGKYLKYDLNRDGNIDIIDVHYVLHTFGN